MNRPPLPRSVLILGQRFKVHKIADLQTDTGNGIERVLGLCDSDDQIIVIEEKQGPDRFAETFLHEQVHAMIALAGLRPDLAEHEEAIVKRLAPIMLDWLRRNPNVYTFFTGRYTYR